MSEFLGVAGAFVAGFIGMWLAMQLDSGGAFWVGFAVACIGFLLRAVLS